MTRRTACPCRTDERGSLSIELAMLAPGMLLIFGLIFAYGVVGQINGTLESGTRDAARSATNSRSYDEAEQRATAVVRDAIKDSPSDCQGTLTVAVSQPFEPGRVVTVTSTCDYGLSQAGLPGVPGTIHAKSSFSSMLDPNRGVNP